MTTQAPAPQDADESRDTTAPAIAADDTAGEPLAGSGFEDEIPILDDERQE